MAVMNNPYSSYNNVKFNTVSRGDLVIMLYDAAMRFTRELKSNIIANNYTGKAQASDNALAVIHELKMSLSYEHSPELATNLSSIYSFISRRLIQANMHNDALAIDVLVEILQYLKEAWNEANKQEKHLAC